MAQESCFAALLGRALPAYSPPAHPAGLGLHMTGLQL